MTAAFSTPKTDLCVTAFLITCAVLLISVLIYVVVKIDGDGKRAYAREQELRAYIDSMRYGDEVEITTGFHSGRRGRLINIIDDRVTVDIEDDIDITIEAEKVTVIPTAERSYSE